MLKQNFLRSLWLWMLFIVVGNVGAQNVAKIGTTEYATLQEAVAAVTDGTATTITMLADVDLAAALTVANTQNITLDLNGKTVKNEASKSLTQLITVNGKLTIDDSSADKAGKIQNTANNNKYVLAVSAADAVLTLANGTVQSTTGTTSKSINASKGTFVMTGGKIISTGYGVSATTVNISGGEISAYDMAVSSGGTISGGTLTSTTKYAVYTGSSSNKQMVVSGGTFNPAAGKAAVVIYCANAKVTGGTFNVSNAKVLDFSVNTATTGVILPGSLYAEDATDAEIYVNGELYGYYSIAATNKMTAPAAETTYKLTKDVNVNTSLTNKFISVPAKVVAINLNGKNITSTGTTALDVAARTSAPVLPLTIDGEGTVSANNGGGCNAVNVNQGVNLTIKGGTYKVGGDDDNTTIYVLKAYEKYPSTVNIEGGDFYATNNGWALNIKDDVRDYAKFYVTGGTFHGFNPADNQAEGNHTNFMAEGYCTTGAEGKFTVTVCDHKAAINAVHYATLADAVAAVPTDGTATTIKMLANADLAAAVTVALGQNIVLDLNGKTITSTKTAISNKGNLEVTGTGNITVTGTSKTTYGISNSGGAALTNRAHLVVGENVTITAPCVAVYTKYGYATINGTLANTLDGANNSYSTLSQSDGSEVSVAASAKITGVVNAIYGSKGTLEVNSTNVGKIYADGSGTSGLNIKKTTALEGVTIVGHAEFSDVDGYYVAAKALSGCTGTVKLLSDINGALALSAGKTVTLDLNGHKVVAETYPIKVEGNLTITGEGTVQSTGMGSSTSVQAATYVLNNGKLTILSGNYVAGYEGEEGNPAVYVRDNAVVEIKGGDFVGGSKYLLNKLDASRETSTIEVTGGTFHNNFNPADNAAEGEHTNFVAEGYESVDNGDGSWTVKQILVSIKVPEEVVTDVPESATVEEKTAANAAVEELGSNTAVTADEATNVAEVESVTTLKIEVKNVAVATSTIEGVAAATITKVVYDVQPMKDEAKVHETDQPITFRLPVPQSFNGTSVKVSHKHNEVITSTYETVQGEGANKFVALSSDKFSEWTLEDVNPSTVAVIGESQYNSLADAIAAVPTNGTATITIVKDIVAPDAMTISGGKNIVLDLNGKTVQHDGAKLFIVGNATLHVTGTGALFENAVDQYAPIIAKGSATDVADYTNIIIDENVTLKGHYSGILIATDAVGTYKNYGLNITMKGKIDLAAVQGAAANFGVGVYVNGKNTVTEGNVMNIDLTGATISGGEIGVYAAGYANWTLNNTTITGYNSAVEVRSGKMEIDGGTYTALNPTFKCTANGNGATVEGAAIAIAQHTTKKDIAVTIKGGEFNGAKSLYEANPQANDPAPQVDLTITDGTFKGAVETTDVNNFISGGSFNEVIPQAYCALGFVPVTTPDADGMYTVEESDTELTVYVGDSTPHTMSILGFLETQETQPNAMAVVSSTNATEVAGMTNVIVDYPVGHSHYYECENFVLDDWYDWYSPVEEFVAVDGSYSRDINEGLTTICVPFDVVENTAFTKYIFHSSNEAGTTAYFNSVAKVNAGEAFLADIHSTNTWNYNFNNTRIYSNTKEGGAIRGTYNTVVNSCLKVNGQGTGLGYFENETTFAFRAYFVLDGVDVFTGSHVQNIRIAFDEIEDATTGISAVGNDADDNVIYNIQGLRQSKQQKGLNIVNGKKVLK